MSREMPFEGKCPTHKVKLEYKGMENVHTGGIGLEIMELIGTFLGGSNYTLKRPVGNENNLRLLCLSYMPLYSIYRRRFEQQCQ